MSNTNGYTVAKIFAEEMYQDNGAYIVSSLMDMIAKMKTVVNTNDIRWIMAMDTYQWIVSTCVNEYGFCHEMQLNWGEENRYLIMDIEVEFVDNISMRENRIVKLSCVEPVVVAWHHEDPYKVFKSELEKGYLADYLDEYVKKDVDATWECFYEKYLMPRNTIAALKEEKLMKSFYVGNGKKVFIENVIFNNPATIVFWSDGTKTVVKKQRGDKKFDPEKGLAMAICKKIMGNKGNFNNMFKEWIEED